MKLVFRETTDPKITGIYREGEYVGSITWYSGQALLKVSNTDYYFTLEEITAIQEKMKEKR